MLEEAVSQSSSSPTLWAVIHSWLTPTVFFVLLQFVIATIYITSNLPNTNHQQQQQQQHHHQQHSQEDDPPRPPRSPLQRLKSINFNSYIHRSQQPHLELHNPTHSHTHEAEQQEIPRSPTILQKHNSIDLHNYYPATPDAHESEKHHHIHNDETHETEEHQHLDDTTTVENDEEEEEDKGEEAGPSFDDIYSQILEGQGRHFTRSHSDTTAASGQVPVKLPGKSASTKSALSHFTEDDIVAVENRRPASVREGKVTAVDSGGDDSGVDAKADDFINKFKQQLKRQRLESVAR